MRFPRILKLQDFQASLFLTVSFLRRNGLSARLKTAQLRQGTLTSIVQWQVLDRKQTMESMTIFL